MGLLFFKCFNILKFSVFIPNTVNINRQNAHNESSLGFSIFKSAKGS